MSDAHHDAVAQAAADRLYAGEAGPLWRVSVGGWPTVLLPAADRDLAVGRYNQLVGITGSSVPHAAELVEDYPAALPECGLKELSDESAAFGVAAGEGPEQEAEPLQPQPAGLPAGPLAAVAPGAAATGTAGGDGVGSGDPGSPAVPVGGGCG